MPGEYGQVFARGCVHLIRADLPSHSVGRSNTIAVVYSKNVGGIQLYQG